MKRTLIILILCGASALANAQNFGKTLISGSVNFTSSKNNFNQSAGQEAKINSFSINPQVGFFLSPIVALGVSATYTRGTYSSSYPTNYPDNVPRNISYTSISNSYSGGPFVRVYKSITPKFGFFGHGTGYYTYSKSKTEHEDDFVQTTPSIGKGGGVSINPGVVFFPTNTIGVEATLGRIGYSSHKTESEGYTPIDSSGFEANLGLSTFTLGISLYLGRTASE
ncbi:hypothetical protein [Rufibacter hautae]|uniref:Outer membrane protein beta-barrel domain-containing protein n=1 Tax=Rufibacter hautae TaxID=2595005 RepID=A0A5B6TK15_9BACT|nr:hypothetical protein [Rufibacter hautae]KAA3440326.1 hypothetical protein FOA19_06630 [Rufibacter hautae]